MAKQRTVKYPPKQGSLSRKEVKQVIKEISMGKIYTTDKHKQEIDLKGSGIGSVEIFSSPGIELPTNKTHQVRKCLIEEINAITGETRHFQSNLLFKGAIHPSLLKEINGNTAMNSDHEETHVWNTLDSDDISVESNPTRKPYGSSKTIRIWDNCYVMNTYERRDDYTISPAILKLGLPFLIDEADSQQLDPAQGIFQMTSHFGSILTYNDPHGFSEKNNTIKMVYIAGFGWHANLKEIGLTSVTLLPVE